VLLLTSHPPLDFYATVAVILPVLFLAAMVENRLSATASSEAESDDDLMNRVLGFLYALVGVVVGETACLWALWHGQGSANSGGFALIGVVAISPALVVPLIGRLRVEIGSGGQERKARALRIVMQMLVVLVVIVVAHVLSGIL
jgi:hypothetical protein